MCEPGTIMKENSKVCLELFHSFYAYNLYFVLAADQLHPQHKMTTAVDLHWQAKSNYVAHQWSQSIYTWGSGSWKDLEPAFMHSNDGMSFLHLTCYQTGSILCKPIEVNHLPSQHQSQVL